VSGGTAEPVWARTRGQSFRTPSGRLRRTTTAGQREAMSKGSGCAGSRELRARPVYVASPLGFCPAGRRFRQHLNGVLRRKRVTVLDPWSLPESQLREWARAFGRKQTNHLIGRRNADLIDRADAVRIPMKVATRSEGNRPAIPIESGRPAGSERSDDAGLFTWSLLYPFFRLSARVCFVSSLTPLSA